MVISQTFMFGSGFKEGLPPLLPFFLASDPQRTLAPFTVFLPSSRLPTPIDLSSCLPAAAKEQRR